MSEVIPIKFKEGKNEMKHRWKRRSDGEIDEFAVTGEFHNGPICAECGYSFCEHCQPEEWDSECPGREGFKIRLDNYNGYLFGFRWINKIFDIGFGFITVHLDFSGLFPYCNEVEEEW